MKKKLIALLSAMAVSLSTICSALPAAAYTADEAVVAAELSSETVAPGGSFTVDLNLKQNPGLTGAEVYVTFADEEGEKVTDALTISSIKNKELLRNDSGAFSYSGAKTTGKSMFFSLDPEAGLAYETGVLATYSIDVSADAPEGIYDVVLTTSEGGFRQINSDGTTTRVPRTLESAKITVVETGKDANLKSLTVKGDSALTLEPAFRADVLDYNVTVPFGENVPTVEYTLSDPAASVVPKQATGFGAENKATITVTSANGKVTNPYTVTFTQQERTAAPDITTDNSTALSRVSGVIEITAAEGTIYYTTDGTVPTASSKVYPAGGIKVSELGIDLDVNKVTIKAIAVATGKAASEVVTKEFTLKDAGAVLSDLTINGKTVSGFKSGTLDYTYEVSYADWKKNPDQTYEINGTASKGTILEISIPASVNVSDPDKGAEIKLIITVSPEEGDNVTYSVTVKVLPCPHKNEKDANVVAAKCVAAGSKDVVCDDCGTTIKTGVVIEALGHQWAATKTTKAATCTADGEEYYVCVREGCDDPTVQKDFVVISKLGHSWGAWESTDGINYTRTCANDETHKETKTVAAAEDGHIHSFTVAAPAETDIDPTCKTEGTATYKCSVDDCEVTIEQSAPTIAHNPVAVEGKNTAPTCTAAGHEYTECSMCHEKMSDKEIPAKGHSYDSYGSDSTGHWLICSVCGHTDLVEQHSGNPCSVCGYISGNGGSTTPVTSTGSAPGFSSAGAPANNAVVSESFNVKVQNVITGKNSKVRATRTGSMVTISVGKDNNGYYANIFDENGDFVNAVIIKSGKARLSVPEGIDFHVVVDEFAYGEDVSSAAGIYDSFSEMPEVYCAILIVLAAFGVSAIVLKKRFAKSK